MVINGHKVSKVAVSLMDDRGIILLYTSNRKGGHSLVDVAARPKNKDAVDFAGELLGVTKASRKSLR